MIILLMRLAFMEVRQCVSRKRLIKVSFPQSTPELTAPAFESRDERVRLPTA